MHLTEAVEDETGRHLNDLGSTKQETGGVMLGYITAL